MIVVLLLAAGGSWESRSLAMLGEHPDIVVLKRCVDVDDLLAAAASGQAEVAVLGLDAPGLDATVTDHLRRHGVRPVAVAAADRLDQAQVRATRLGIAAVVADDDLTALPVHVRAAETVDAGPPDLHAASTEPAGPLLGGGRVLAVWGPTGAPGRSTVAAAVAAEIGRRGRRTVLVDADPFGGTLAQQLGILDEVSGLLSAARLVVAGQLEERFGSVQRGVDARLSVVTGLPRADRWVEVRPGTIEQLLEIGCRHADVVVDTGFCLEDDAGFEVGARPSRHQLTLEAIGSADEVLAVGTADPVGLTRLARGLSELREVADTVPVRVVVNRMRPTLGWSERDVTGMLGSFTSVRAFHFLPDDRSAVDRALVAGRTLVEVGDSALARAVSALVDAF